MFSFSRDICLDKLINIVQISFQEIHHGLFKSNASTKGKMNAELREDENDQLIVSLRQTKQL